MADAEKRRATLAARRASLAAGMAGITEGDDFEYEEDEEEEDFWANIDILKMSRVELKIALEARGLSVKGSKKELRARLELLHPRHHLHDLPPLLGSRLFGKIVIFDKISRFLTKSAILNRTS